MKVSVARPYNLTNDGEPDFNTIPEPGPFPVPFAFEKNVDFVAWLKFMTKYWYLPHIVAAVYIVTIFSIKHFMKERKPFHLKRELFIWNAGLGIFSIVAFNRIWSDFFGEFMQTDGFYKSLCQVNYSHAGAYWSLMFILSKFVELGDTVFIALRKRPIVVLQWYHHAITMIGSWLAAGYVEPVNRWLLFVNLGVHSFMYPYFALKALDIHIPKWIANMITTMQLGQMFLAFYVQSYTAYLYLNGSCYRHPSMMAFVMVVNVTFIYLFGDLFYKSVILNTKNKQQKKKVE